MISNLDEEMENWTRCKQSVSKGNILTWYTNYVIETKLIGIRNKQLSELCEPETLGLTILPQKYSYMEGLTACRLV